MDGKHMTQLVAQQPKVFHETAWGQVILADSLRVLAQTASGSVDLIMTSPPFGLVRKKDYGNVDAERYVEWFKPFGTEFHRVLKDGGSLVIDIGGAWIPGQPTRSLYQYKLLIMLCEELGFHLAQEFFWWNPSRLPTPAEWVTVRRIRVKDAVNTVWWLSPTPWPKASNRRVLQPYSESMLQLLQKGYKAKLRPSGHDISEKFSKNNGAAIPPNLIGIAHTESNSQYQRYCKKHGLKVHPARFPPELPEFFVRMLTDESDLVVDPFAGSCVTGEVCDRLRRRWLCIDLEEEYLKGALGRFYPKSAAPRGGRQQSQEQLEVPGLSSPTKWPNDSFYRLARPSLLWNGSTTDKLGSDGGRERAASMKSSASKKRTSARVR
jgi:site-specific DNA-methyltransferase (cytosine-N4-specific)